MDARQPDGMRVIDVGLHVRDFADTAAILSLLDLTVTCDTAVANLAGALDCPVWVLLQGANMGFWRWGPGDRSAWYPSARCFRQQTLGDWSHPVEQVAEELAKLAAECKRGAA